MSFFTYSFLYGIREDTILVPLFAIHVRVTPFCSGLWCSLAILLIVHYGCYIGYIPLDRCSFFTLPAPCILIFSTKSTHHTTLVLSMIMCKNCTILNHLATHSKHQSLLQCILTHAAHNPIRLL